MPSPKGKDEATCAWGGVPSRRLSPWAGGLARLLSSLRPPATPQPPRNWKSPVLQRGQKDSAPPDPQMLHEHIVRGTHAPGSCRAPRPPLPLVSGSVLPPRHLLSSLTPKCFRGPPGRPRMCSVALLCWGEGGGESGLKHRVQVWVPVCMHLSPSPPHDQTNPILSDLLWPLRCVRFLTPAWNWLSSSKDQSCSSLSTSPPLPAPCEERVNIYFFIYLLFVLGGTSRHGPQVLTRLWQAGLVCPQPSSMGFLPMLPFRSRLSPPASSPAPFLPVLLTGAPH